MKLMEQKANRSPLFVEAGTAGVDFCAYTPHLLLAGKSNFRPFRQVAAELKEQSLDLPGQRRHETQIRPATGSASDFVKEKP